MGKSASEVRADIEGTRDDMSHTIDAIADRTSPSRIIQRRRDRMADGWRSVRERVMGKADDVRSSASDGGQGLVDSARSGAGSLAESARQAPDVLTQQTQGNPIAAGLIAFGGGLLVASLIPPTEPEKRLAGTVKEQTQPLQDELKQAGQQVTDELKQSAQQGVEQVRQRATEAAGTVREDARGSAEHLREEARR